MKPISRLFFALVFAQVFAAAAARGQPSISFEKSDVVVDVEPFANVMIAGAGQFFQEGITSLIDGRTVLADNDGDGRVSWSVGRDVPDDSVWLAVSDGGYSYASPGDVEVLVTDFPEAVLDFNGSLLSRISLAEDRGIFLVSRPGLLSWEVAADDGGAHDHDGAYNGAVEIESSDMLGIGGHRVVHFEFTVGDVVAFLDLQAMRLSVTVITPEDIENRSLGN